MTVADIVTLPLPERTVVRLVELRHSPDETIPEVIERLAGLSDQAVEAGKDTCPDTTSGGARYVVEVLGEDRTADSLSDVLAWTFNTLADLDGTILERLENIRGRTRRAVARKREAIHPGRHDLNGKYTLEFRPGWWMGINHSYRNVCRILEQACHEAGLDFGEDLKFRRRNDAAVNRLEDECPRNS